MDIEPRPTSVSVNGIKLHVRRSGPADGRPVILLHGFPEGWRGWRRQIGPLADAGFQVLAPDQRGYDASDKPRGVAAYALDVLADDVLGLIDTTGQSRASLVGHDWGGIVAWWTSIRNPERVERLAILNAPHPIAFRRFLLTHPVQLLKSWYMFAFQLPALPEATFRRSHWRLLSRAMVESSRAGTFSDDDLAEYRQGWSEPGAIKAMIHWYRAAFRHPPRVPGDLRVRVPTLLIFGMRDRFLDSRLIEPTLAFCDSARLERFAESTHWVQHEEPARVNRMLIDFLRSGNGSTQI